MSAATEDLGTARAFRPSVRSPRPAMATVRLRFKPAHRSGGFVQGAWWPRSTRLAAELPSLLAALSSRYGPIDRVRYHHSDWSPAAPTIDHHDDVVLEAAHDSPNVLTAFGNPFGRLALLVVPPHLAADDAYTAMTTAASAGDVSSPDQLLGISERGAKDRHHALAAMQRWECDGGALGRPHGDGIPVGRRNSPAAKASNAALVTASNPG